jgi:hypothetical protein
MMWCLTANNRGRARTCARVDDKQIGADGRAGAGARRCVNVFRGRRRPGRSWAAESRQSFSLNRRLSLVG